MEAHGDSDVIQLLVDNKNNIWIDCGPVRLSAPGVAQSLCLYWPTTGFCGASERQIKLQLALRDLCMYSCRIIHHTNNVSKLRFVLLYLDLLGCNLKSISSKGVLLG